MKNVVKLLFVFFAFLVILSCNDEEFIEDMVVSDQVSASLVIRNSESNPDVDFLQSQSDFNTAGLNAISEINSFLDDIRDGLDFSELTTEEGYLVFNSSENFQQILESIEQSDEEYQTFLDNKYDILLENAMENSQILAFYENDEEEIINGIEEFLWHYNVYDHNLQNYVSDNLPINTLWQNIKTQTDQWLEESGEDLNLENDPSDLYVDNEYLQLLLNENSNIKISGNLEIYEEAQRDFSNGFQARAQSCITKTRKWVAQSGKRKLTVKLFVRDHGAYKEAGAAVIGYKKKRGRWKRRRFGKNLSVGGRVIYNSIFSCEFDMYVSKTKSSKRRRFRAIALRSFSQEHNLRVFPDMRKFGATANGGGVYIAPFYL